MHAIINAFVFPIIVSCNASFEIDNSKIGVDLIEDRYSVRDKGGQCIAALRPSAISIPLQSKHLAYVWNGAKISRIVEKSELVIV